MLGKSACPLGTQKFEIFEFPESLSDTALVLGAISAHLCHLLSWLLLRVVRSTALGQLGAKLTKVRL